MATAQHDCKECDGTGVVAGSQAHFKCPICFPAIQSDDALIKQCMDALECAAAYTALIDEYSRASIQEALEACRTRLGGQHAAN